MLIFQFSVPMEILMQGGFTLARQDVHVDEDLPEFFDVVKLVDAHAIISENDTM